MYKGIKTAIIDYIEVNKIRNAICTSFSEQKKIQIQSLFRSFYHSTMNNSYIHKY